MIWTGQRVVRHRPSLECVLGSCSTAVNYSRVPRRVIIWPGAQVQAYRRSTNNRINCVNDRVIIYTTSKRTVQAFLCPSRGPRSSSWSCVFGKTSSSCRSPEIGQSGARPWNSIKPPALVPSQTSFPFFLSSPPHSSLAYVLAYPSPDLNTAIYTMMEQHAHSLPTCPGYKQTKCPQRHQDAPPPPPPQRPSSRAREEVSTHDHFRRRIRETTRPRLTASEKAMTTRRGGPPPVAGQPRAAGTVSTTTPVPARAAWT